MFEVGERSEWGWEGLDEAAGLHLSFRGCYSEGECMRVHIFDFAAAQVNQKDEERFERPSLYESTSFSLTPLYQDAKHCSQVSGFSLLNLQDILT